MAIENTVTFCKNATNLVEILILDNLYRSRLRFFTDIFTQNPPTNTPTRLCAANRYGFGGKHSDYTSRPPIKIGSVRICRL